MGDLVRSCASAGLAAQHSAACPFAHSSRAMRARFASEPSRTLPLHTHTQIVLHWLNKQTHKLTQNYKDGTIYVCVYCFERRYIRLIIARIFITSCCQQFRPAHILFFMYPAIPNESTRGGYFLKLLKEDISVMHDFRLVVYAAQAKEAQEKQQQFPFSQRYLVPAGSLKIEIQEGRTAGKS